MRLFVGLDLPVEVRERLAGLAGGIPGARWVAPHTYHLTLRFIGDVAAPQAEEIDTALSALRGKGFDLTLAGLGTFSNGPRGTRLWVGVAPNPALGVLRAKVEHAVQRAGLAPLRRRFTPYVTLANLDCTAPSRLVEFVQAHNLFRAGAIAIRRFCLFSSRLGKDAVDYTVEVEYPLAPWQPSAS